MEVVLQLNYTGLTELTAEFCENNTHIERLYLKRNKLKTLPKEILCFTNLIELYLPANELFKLPAEIGCLKNLKYLDVSSNFLKDLPPSIGDLNKLEKLNISINNFLTILPSEIGNLKKLLTFEAAYINLRKFPVQLCDCESLQKLCLDRNFIRYLPRDVEKLKNLQDLSVCGNRLVSLSHNLLKLKKIRDIYVDPELSSYPYKLPITHLGCGRLNPVYDEDEFCSVRIQDNGDLDRLCLGNDVNSFGHPVTRPVPLLLELSYRALSALSLDLKIELKDQLPCELSEVLTSPTCGCLNCNQPIFIDGLIGVVKKQDDLHISTVLYETILCCSVNCLQYVLHELPSNYTVLIPDGIT